MAKRTSDSKHDKGEPGSAGGERSPYLVLARKYRPRTFEDLIGQEAMVTTLRNAFATGRLAQAYMLTGVRGVGKTTTARILARALNYRRGDIDRPTIEMPELGEHCAEIIESRHPDIIEMDAASNTGIDNVREIIEGARYRPVAARYKVYIIDEVHMLSKGAFNALLKTLEEPPEHVKFVFATTEVRKVPVTVLSRCQRFDLRRVDAAVLTQHFRRIGDIEGIDIDDEAMALIARASEGSVRDGLSMLDQAFATGTGQVSAADVRAMLGLADRGRILDLLEDLLAGKAADALERFAALHADGAEPVQVLGDLAEAVHVVTRIRVAGMAAATDTLSGEERKRVDDLAQRLGVPLLSRAWQMLLKGLEEVGRSPDGFAAAEMVLIRLAHVAELPSPDEIARRFSGGDSASTGAVRAAGPSSSPGNGGGGRSGPSGVGSGGGEGGGGEAIGRRARAGSPFAATAPRGQRAHLALVVEQPEAETAAEPTVESESETDGVECAELIATPTSVAPTNVVALAFGDPVRKPGPGAAAGDANAITAAADDLESVTHLDDADDPGFDPGYFDRAADDEPMPVSGPQFMNFEGMVAYIGEKRDLQLKIQIEDHARLVSYTHGRIELNLKPGVSANLLNELSQKLSRWTGERWVAALSREPGEKTLSERRDEELAALKQLDPLKSALAAFPGAEITEVRDLEPDFEGVAAQDTDNKE